MGIAERSLISQQHKLLEKRSEFSQVNFTCVISFPFRTTVVQKGKLLKIFQIMAAKNTCTVA